jgi:hypothetical protein
MSPVRVRTGSHCRLRVVRSASIGARTTGLSSRQASTCDPRLRIGDAFDSWSDRLVYQDRLYGCSLSAAGKPTLSMIRTEDERHVSSLDQSAMSCPGARVNLSLCAAQEAALTSTAPESQLPPTSGTTAALERPRWWLPRDAPADSVFGAGRRVLVVVLGSPGCDLPAGRTRVCAVWWILRRCHRAQPRER